MTLHLAVLCAGTSFAAEPPAILIDQAHGMLIAWNKEDLDKFAYYGLEVAIWPNGRVIWGKPERALDGRVHRG